MFYLKSVSTEKESRNRKMLSKQNISVAALFNSRVAQDKTDLSTNFTFGHTLLAV
jgi:hypothetical protein